MTFQHQNGGVAEFRLTDGISDQVVFNFSNVISGVAGKGVALANFENFTTDVTFYAIGNNRQVLDTTVVSLSRRSRIVGLHTEWFPSINLNDISSIIVRSSEARIAGVTISAGNNNEALLFSASEDASTFTNGTFPDTIAIKDYFPFYDNNGSYSATNEVTVEYNFGSNNVFSISISKDDSFMRGWALWFDSNGNLRYYDSIYPMGQKFTNDPFTIVPAMVDLNRKYTFNDGWDFVNRYDGSPAGQVTIDTLVQGPHYVVVPAGAFEEVIKLTIEEESTFSWWGSGNAIFLRNRYLLAGQRVRYRQDEHQ